MTINVDASEHSVSELSNVSRSPYNQIKYNQLTFSAEAIPTLVFMAGFAGAGKTDLAVELSEKRALEVLIRDEFKRTHLKEGKDVRTASWEAYEDLFREVEDRIAIRGNSVIIDSSGRDFVWQRIKERLSPYDVKIHVRCILCKADKEERSRRLMMRGSTFYPYIKDLPLIREDRDIDKVYAHLPSDTLILNTNPVLEDYLQKALDYIDRISYNI